MPVAEIQTGGNSFNKIRYLFSKNHYFLRKSRNFDKLIISSANSAKKTHVFRKGVIFANSAKMTHVSHGWNL